MRSEAQIKWYKLRDYIFEKAMRENPDISVSEMAEYFVGYNRREIGGIKKWLMEKMDKPKNYHVSCQCGCGKQFLRFDDHWDARSYFWGHNKIKRAFTLPKYILPGLKIIKERSTTSF